MNSSASAIQTGMIIIWSGSIADIPPGWLLCDGNNGTPDFSDRFIRSTVNEGDIGDKTTSGNHKHSFIADGHYHQIVQGSLGGDGTGGNDWSDIVSVTGDTAYTDVKPPYYTCAFIMKV